MKKFLERLFAVVILILFGAPIVAVAAGVFIVDQGGTGWNSFTANTILLGNGKNRLATTTAGANGQYLVLLNGIPKWATASSSAVGTVTSIATTFPILGGTITNTGTLTFGGLSTTSSWTQGGVAVAGALQNTLFTTPTTTLSATGVITITAGAVVLGASPITIACSTCSTTTGTVTSIAFGDGLVGGTITTSGNVNLKSYFATSTADTAGYVMYSGSTNGWPAKVAYVATTSQTLSSAFSSSGSFGALIGGTTGTLSSVIQPSFVLMGTTTGAGTFAPLFGATTSLALQQLVLGETINGVRCRTDVGTANVQFGNGAASTSLINASTTNNFNAYTSNNTPTVGQQVIVDIGTFSGSPTKINCTVKLTI